MPDIFDQITAEPARDIFDQIAPGGDIFDQITAQPEVTPVETTPAAAEFPGFRGGEEVVAKLGEEVSTLDFGERPAPGPGDLGLGPVKSAAKQILRFGPSLAKTANQAIGFVGGQVESTSKAIREVSDNKFWQQAWAPYERAGAAVRKFGLESAQDIQKNVLEGQPWLNLPDELKGSLWENPSLVINPEWLAFNVGEAGTSMFPMIAATIVAGPPAGMAVGGGLEGFDLYGDLIEKGVDHDRAATASMSFGMVTAILNKIGLDKIMKKIPGKGVVNNIAQRLGAATTEATTEYMEEPFQAAFGAIAEGKSTDEIIDATLESFKNIDVIPGAFLLGGAAAGTVQNDLRSGDIKKVIAAIKKLDAAREEVFDKFVEDLGPAAESMTEDQQREAFDARLREGAVELDVFDEVQPAAEPDVFDEVQPEEAVEQQEIPPVLENPNYLDIAGRPLRQSILVNIDRPGTQTDRLDWALASKQIDKMVAEGRSQESILTWLVSSSAGKKFDSGPYQQLIKFVENKVAGVEQRSLDEIINDVNAGQAVGTQTPVAPEAAAQLETIEEVQASVAEAAPVEPPLVEVPGLDLAAEPAPFTQAPEITGLEEQKKLIPELFQQIIKTRQELAAEFVEIATLPEGSQERVQAENKWMLEALKNNTARTNPERISSRIAAADERFASRVERGVIDVAVYERDIKPLLDRFNKLAPGLDIRYDGITKNEAGEFEHHSFTISQGNQSGLTFNISQQEVGQELLDFEVKKRLQLYKDEIRTKFINDETLNKFEGFGAAEEAQKPVEEGEDVIVKRREAGKEKLRAARERTARAISEGVAAKAPTTGDARRQRGRPESVDVDKGRPPAEREEVGPKPVRAVKPAKPVRAVKPAEPVAAKPGKKFKGKLGDTIIKGKPPKEGTVMRREDILIPLLKALNQPIFQEAIKKGSQTLGDFLPEGHRIRTQSRSDIEVVAHEIAHLLDNTIYGGFKPGKNKRPWMTGNHPLHKTFRAELNAVSYDESKVTEGFAEFLRHWMTNPETVDQATPEFNQYWEEFLAAGMDGNPKVAKALLKAKDEMRSWFAQTLTARMKSKIGETFDPNVWTNTWSGVFRAAALDSMHGVLANELRLTGERTGKSGGMYETMALTRAAYSQADGSIRFGPIVLNKDGSFSYNTEVKSLHDILKDVSGNLEDFKLYAISRSANELKGQGRENRFTKGEIEKGLKLETPEFKKAFDEWLKFNNETLNFAESMGLISADQRKGWKRAQYLPFFAVSNKKQRGGSGRPGEATVTKMLTGSTRNLNDIIDNMVMSTSKMIVMSIKNQAMRNVVDTTIKAPGGAKWIRKVPKKSARIRIMNEDLKTKLTNALPADQRPMMESMLKDAEENLGEDFGQFFVHGQAPLGDNIIAVRRDGKLEYYQIVDDLLFRSFASMAAKDKGLVRQNMNTVRRLMQGTITTTFDFMGANLARDTLHGWVFSSNGFKPVVDSVKGMNSRIRKDKTYQDWIANGGGMASYFIDEGALRKRMDKFLVKRGISPKSIIDTPRKFAWLIEAMGDATEASTRIGEFKKAVARGDNPRHAAYLSREISTDFAKRGDSEILGWMTDSIMFLNPAIQGLDRVYRGFTKDQNRGQIWVKSATIAAISVGLLLLNDDNDLYEGLDDFDKDGYWHFFIPVNDLMKRHMDPELISTTKDGREFLHTRMPKLWEIGAMASIAERATKHLIDTVKKEVPDGGELAETIRNIMIDQMKFDLVPAAINPLLEQMMNKNRFTQRKIVNTGLERNLPWAQYSPHTSEIPRKVGELTRNLPAKWQISPARLQHLIQGYFNGWGYYGLFLTDNLLPGSRKSAPRWDQFPVVKRFLEQHPRRTKFESDLFELLDESNKLEATFQKMQKNNILPNEKEIENKVRLLGPVLRDTSQTIKDLRDAVNLARLDPEMSRADLRKLEDQVQEEVSKIAEETVKPVKKELRKKDE